MAIGFGMLVVVDCVVCKMNQHTHLPYLPYLLNLMPQITLGVRLKNTEIHCLHIAS